jgi:muramoyltetrapeptide carboxypeptidase
MPETPPLLPRVPAKHATIGIFAPSGRVDPARLSEGVGHLEAAGHRVVISDEALREWRYFAGTDADRLAGFNRLLEDPAIDIMLAARGGYGLSRLLPAIDWQRVRASGKVFVGFSDFTAFNCAALARARLATLHGPMLAIDFGDGEPDEFMVRHFDATLFGPHDAETVSASHGHEPGIARGTLWGGNLSLLAHLVGTPYLPAIDGGILYVEEIAEEPYAVERLFMQLHHAGILQRQKALLLGDFGDCVPKNPSRYPYSMDEVVESLRGILACPVLTGLPFGHVARKLTLPFGVEGEISIAAEEWTLRWPGLSPA